MGTWRLLVLVGFLTIILEDSGVSSSSRHPGSHSWVSVMAAPRLGNIPRNKLAYLNTEIDVSKVSDINYLNAEGSMNTFEAFDVITVPDNSTKAHSQEHHNEGWGWSSPSPPPPEKPNPCEEVKGRNITNPQDIQPGWRLVNTKNRTVDPYLVLDPPLVLIPLAPPQIKADNLPSYETVFIERLSISMDNNLRDAGQSLMRDREFHTQNVTEDKLALVNPSAMSIVTSVVSHRRVSALLKGMEEERGFFKEALRIAQQKRDHGLSKSPLENFLETDLIFMGNLFQEIWKVESKISNEQEDDGDQETTLEMPIMVYRKERRSFPEPDSSERSLLDTEFNFGLPASHFDFERIEATVDNWKEMRGIVGDSGASVVSQKHVSEEYKGMSEFYESLEEFVRSRTLSMDSFGSKSFQEADTRVQELYGVDQFLICVVQEDAECKMCPLDPALFGNKLAFFKGSSSNRMPPRNRVSQNVPG